MDIKPSTMTITQLLSSRCQFSIPRFQREYSWEKRNYQECRQAAINRGNVGSSLTQGVRESQ